MASIYDVAKYILEQFGERDIWELQRLCYYAQAWELVRTGEPFFPEDFQAWRSGPVCQELLNAFEGRTLITASNFLYGNSSSLTKEQKAHLDSIVLQYSDIHSSDIKNQMANEKPWTDARGDLPYYAKCKTVITKSSMLHHYRNMQLPSLLRT